MNCEAVLNVEDLYLEDRLSPSRRSHVSAHLAACGACRVRLKPVIEPLPAVAAPKSLKDRLRQNLKAMSEKLTTAVQEPAPPLLSPQNDAWPVLVSAAVYVGLALLLAWLGPGVRSQAYVTPPVAAQGRMP